MNSFTKLIILSFTISYSIYAQRDTSGHIGYVITLQSDTIKGLVYNHHKYSHAYIVVKNINNTTKDSIFLPKTVLGYEANHKIFRTVKLPIAENSDSIYQFAEIVVNGPITMYETKIKTDFILPPKKAFLVEKMDRKEFLPFGKIDYIVPFVQDYEQLRNDILSYKYDNSFHSKKLVVEQYNDWVKKK